MRISICKIVLTILPSNKWLQSESNCYTRLLSTINVGLFTLFLMLNLLPNTNLSGQTPGCVATDLTAWYNANVGVTGTTSISGWEDQSGNGFDVAPRSASSQPALTGVMNFNPAIEFENSNLQITNTVLSASSAATVFGAGTNKGDSGYEVFTSFGTDYPHLGKGGGTNGFFLYSNGFSSHPENITANQNQVYAWSWDATRTGIQVRLDGNAADFTKNNFAVGAGLSIGGTLNSGAEDWEGKIGEVLVYERELLNWEKEKIESYLSIKYGTTLPHNYYLGDWDGTSGTTIWTVGGGYDTDIAGIGQDDCQGLLQKQSKSVNDGRQPTIFIGDQTAGLPTMNADNASNFDTDGSFLLWGNNGMKKEYTQVYAPNSFTPSGGYYMMDAIWKVKETGTVGTVTVQGPTGAAHLLIHDNANFSTGTPTEIALVDDGNGNTVATVDLIDGQFFTFARGAFAPGCVAANLAAWYKADAGITGDFKVPTWYDQSTNNHDLVQNTTSRQPILSGLMNYNPALSFDGSNDRLQYLDPILTSGSSASIFGAGVNNATSGYENFAVFGLDHPHLGITGSSNRFFMYRPGFEYHSNDYINGQNQIYGWTWENGGGAAQVRLDGVIKNLTGKSLSIGQSFRVGGSSYGEIWTGQIGEVIIYDRDLESWEKDKVESYLAIKYGTTLPHNYYAGDWNGTAGTTLWTTSGGYDADIAGIGQDDCQQLLQKQSKSVNDKSQPAFFLGDHTGGLPTTNTDNTASFAGTGNFMFWGNNGLSENYSTSYTPHSFTPEGGYFIMPAVWTVQETGTVGTVTVQGPTGAAHLLIHDNADFSTGTPTEIALTDDGNGNMVATVDLATGQFFTFGRNAFAPGCVVANLTAWYKADIGVTGTTEVTDWIDQSGNGFDMEQTQSSRRPSLSGEMNYNPTLLFDGSSDRLIYDDPILDKESPASIFGAGVNNGTSGYENFAVFGSDFPHLGITGSSNRFFMYRPGFEYHSNDYINGQNQIYGWTWENDDGAAQVRLDGVIENLTGKSISVGQSFRIGGSSYGEIWTGQIGEVIIYDRDLESWEKDKVESYLAVKYGVSMSHNYYAGDWDGSLGTIIYTTGAGYDNNITVIGRDDCQKLLQKQSRSADADALVTIGIDTIATTNAENTGDFDTNGSFVAFGSNSDANTFTSEAFTEQECFVPETVEAVSDQRWQLKETGDVASTRLELPLSFFTNRVSTELPIYLIYADDSDLNTNRTSISGTIDDTNNIVYFNVDFPANSTVYFGFAGGNSNSPSNCESCEGGDQYFNPGKAFGVSCSSDNQSNNTVTGVTTVGGNADITADLSVTFPAGVKEFASRCWPRQYGKWLQLIRYDGEVGTSGDVVYRTKLSKGARPSFDIGSVDYFIGQEDEIEVIGYCDGVAVANSFTSTLHYPSSNTYGSTYGTVDNEVDGGDARDKYIYYASPYWKYGTLHIEFTKTVDEVEVRWRQKARRYGFNYYQYLYMGPMRLECPYIPVCERTEKMYVNLKFDQPDYSVCDTATMYLKLINRGCDTQVLDLENILPTDNTNYLPGSLNPDALIAGGGSIGTVNAYGGSTTLDIQDLTVPVGEFTLPIQLYAKTQIDTIPIQATFQLENGESGVSDCGNDIGKVLIFVDEPVPYIPEVSLTASDTCYDVYGNMTYTLSFNNSSGSAAYPMNVSMLLGTQFTVDGGSVDYSNASMISNANFSSNELDEEGLFNLYNLTIPNGASTIEVSALANSSREDAKVRVEITGDITSTCAVVNTKLDSLTIPFDCTPISAAGEIDCSKTQIVTAPVEGQAGQKMLVVTVAVNREGCFFPITVEGSGMSIANRVEVICTDLTGVQQLYIPLYYDGSPLDVMEFTIGDAGSCSADLRLKAPRKKVITDVWTLDCVPIAGPSLK